jgi:hypothetical protein
LRITDILLDGASSLPRGEPEPIEAPEQIPTIEPVAVAEEQPEVIAQEAPTSPEPEPDAPDAQTQA